MMNKRGWHREPIRHSLASKGVETSIRTKQFSTLDFDTLGDMVADKLKNSDMILIEPMLIRTEPKSDMMMIDFHLEGVQTGKTSTLSDIVYREGDLGGMIRFPQAKIEDLDEIEEKLDEVENKFDFIEKTHFRQNLDSVMLTPHFKFKFENVRKKHIDEYIDRVLKATEEVLELYD